MADRIVIHHSLAALKAERAKLARIQQREYQTRGNTQRYQEIWKKIEAIEAQINSIMNQIKEEGD